MASPSPPSTDPSCPPGQRRAATNLQAGPAGAVACRTLAVVALFGVYAVAVFHVPVGAAPEPTPATDAEPAGPRAWRQAGCHFCHSLYGLGGHTGPDLTNVASRRPPEFIRTVVRSGLRGMPPYQSIDPTDLDSIVAYLAEVDHTAEYPPREFLRGVFGAR